MNAKAGEPLAMCDPCSLLIVSGATRAPHANMHLEEEAPEEKGMYEQWRCWGCGTTWARIFGPNVPPKDMLWRSVREPG